MGRFVVVVVLLVVVVVGLVVVVVLRVVVVVGIGLQLPSGLDWKPMSHFFGGNGKGF